MILELTRNHTKVTLSDEPWQRGIQRIVVEGKEIPFLLPALTGHHFFTGAWPPPPEAIDYEPHISPGYLTRRSAGSALWHQPATPYTQVETRIQYTILGPGTIEARFETRSHAASYPYGYVGLFWGTIAAPGGQRGFHTLMPGDGRRVHWYYFQGGGDDLSPRANTILGPDMPPAAHSPEHPPTYFFAEAGFTEAAPAVCPAHPGCPLARSVLLPGDRLCRDRLHGRAAGHRRRRTQLGCLLAVACRGSKRALLPPHGRRVAWLDSSRGPLPLVARLHGAFIRRRAFRG